MIVSQYITPWMYLDMYLMFLSHDRSSLHCSDAGQVNGHPIIHVNADHPEVYSSRVSLVLLGERVFIRLGVSGNGMWYWYCYINLMGFLLVFINFYKKIILID